MRIGIAAATAALGAVAIWAWATGDGTLAGVTARTSLILAAAWLAWPSLTTVTWKSTGLVSLGIAILAWRPRAAWIVLPVLGILFSRPKQIRSRPE